MDRPQLPLNALRAFEAAARHLSLTRAAVELCVTQAAVSHHVAALEARLGVALFRRVPRGLVLTSEGAALVPVLSGALDAIAATLDRVAGGRHETLHVGVVGTFAVGWLMPRLRSFEALHPTVDLRIATNNNRVDLAAEGLDLAIRFGDGRWHGTEARELFPAAMTPLCRPGLARALAHPCDLADHVLLRSYRADEWPRWFEAAGAPCPLLRGPTVDTSLALAEMAADGHGVALLPARLFDRHVEAGRLARPFTAEIVTGSYWLTRLLSREPSPAMRAFEAWLLAAA